MVQNTDDRRGENVSQSLQQRYSPVRGRQIRDAAASSSMVGPAPSRTRTSDANGAAEQLERNNPPLSAGGPEVPLPFAEYYAEMHTECGRKLLLPMLKRTWSQCIDLKQEFEQSQAQENEVGAGRRENMRRA